MPQIFWEKNKFNIGKQKPPCLPTEWHLFGLKCNSILQKSKQVVMWFCYGPWEYQTKSSLRKGHTSSERGGANGLQFLLLYLLILYLLCSYMRNCVTKQKNKSFTMHCEEKHPVQVFLNEAWEWDSNYAWTKENIGKFISINSIQMLSKQKYCNVLDLLFTSSRTHAKKSKYGTTNFQKLGEKLCGQLLLCFAY